MLQLGGVTLLAWFHDTQAGCDQNYYNFTTQYLHHKMASWYLTYTYHMKHYLLFHTCLVTTRHTKNEWQMNNRLLSQTAISFRRYTVLLHVISKATHPCPSIFHQSRVRECTTYNDFPFLLVTNSSTPLHSSYVFVSPLYLRGIIVVSSRISKISYKICTFHDVHNRGVRCLQVQYHRQDVLPQLIVRHSLRCQCLSSCKALNLRVSS